MTFASLGFVAVILAMLSSLALLVSHHWRWSVIALAVQYIAVFWLVAIHWPLGLSAVKLIVGWMAGAVLAASRPGDELELTPFLGLSGRLFHGIAAVMSWLLIFAVAPELQRWLPTSAVVIQGGMILIIMGLLQLGFSTNPLRIVLGLLTTLSGFEILYASVEVSVLVAGLLGVVNLGLALVGAYVILSPGLEEVE